MTHKSHRHERKKLVVRGVIIRDLNLDPDVVSKMIIVRCHRLGKYAANDGRPKFHRPTIIRFLNYNENRKYGLNISRLHCQGLHAKFDYIRLLIDKFMQKDCPL